MQAEMQALETLPNLAHNHESRQEENLGNPAKLQKMPNRISIKSRLW